MKKEKLISLTEQYEKINDYEVKKEILEVLFAISYSEGFRISVVRPANLEAWEEKNGEEWDRYKYMIFVLRDVYKKLKNRPKVLALEFYDIAAAVLEEDM